MEKSVKTDFEAKSLNYDDVQRSLYNHSNYISSSLCQESETLSYLKASDDIIIESSARSAIIPSTCNMISQETEAKDSYMPPTRPREIGSPSITIHHQIQHQNEPISPHIDLQEDFDCVEQSWYHTCLISLDSICFLIIWRLSIV